MKATIDFDDQLYRRLKIEAARRGRTVRELVSEGVRYVLDGEGPQPPEADTGDEISAPPWFGMLGAFAKRVDDHSVDAIRASVAKARMGAEAPDATAS